MGLGRNTIRYTIRNSLFVIYDIYVVPASYGCSSKLRGHGLQSLASTALSPAFSLTLSNSHHNLADVLDAEVIHTDPLFTHIYCRNLLRAQLSECMHMNL